MARDMVEVTLELEGDVMKLRGFLALLSTWYGDRGVSANEGEDRQGASWLLYDCCDLASKIEAALCSSNKALNSAV